MIIVETEKLLYQFRVVNPSHNIVHVESGDPHIGNDLLYKVESIQKGDPIVFQLPSGLKRTSPVKHVVVSGVGPTGQWSYEVF